jgi:hypothetical protein
MNILRQAAAAAGLFLVTLAVPCSASSADGQKIAALLGPGTSFGSQSVVTPVDHRGFLGCVDSEHECAHLAGDNGYDHYRFVHDHSCPHDHDACYGFND